MEWCWYDIDLDAVETYKTWKPRSLAWASTVDWALVNDLVRKHPDDFPANDLDLALTSADKVAALTEADREGLFSLYGEPIFATPDQIYGGGHRITAMRSQGVRWALGKCHLEDIGSSVNELHAYLPSRYGMSKPANSHQGA
jgi:hypothetical protein